MLCTTSRVQVTIDACWNTLTASKRALKNYEGAVDLVEGVFYRDH